MKIVLNTNVLIAAFATRGQCSELFEHCARDHSLVTSAFLLNEFKGTLTNKLKIAHRQAEAAAALLRNRMQGVTPSLLEGPVCHDPDDDQVLATAVAGGCECIITGDRDLLDLGRYQGVEILSPAEFWRYEASQ